MNRFKFGHAAGGGWLEIVDQCLQQAGPISQSHSLGFIYLTDPLSPNTPDILDYLRAHTGVEHWVGCVGIGICATGREYYAEPAIALMLADFPEDTFQVFSLTDSKQPLDSVRAGWLEGQQPWFGIVHGNPENAQLEDLLRGLAKQLSSGFVTGGLASSHGVSISLADNVVQEGLSGVVFTEAIPVSTRLSQGCRPIGPRRTVTECDENILISIDHKPALDVFKEDIGEVLAKNIRRVGGYIFAGLPITGSDRNEYLVRNLMGLDPDNRLLAIGALVEAGDPILFCKRDADSAREDLQHMLDGLIQAINGRSVRGAVYVSCLGRGASLFGPNSRELQIIEEKLGPVPLVGFYANGEISGNRIYGYTGVLTVFL